MRVYIEYALADNLFFDWLLLFVTDKTLHKNSKQWRLVLAAVVGAVGAVAVSLIDANRVWVLLAKTALFCLITIVAFLEKKLSKTCIAAGVFFGYTLLLGGCLFGGYFLILNNQETISVLNKALKLPLGLYGGGIVCFAYLIFAAVRGLNKAVKTRRFGCKVRLFACQKYYDFEGFLDSGNTLTDGKLPVCFLCDTVAVRRLKKDAAQQILNGGYGLKNLHFVSFLTVNGAAKTAVFEAEEFLLDGKKVNCLVAFGVANSGFDVLVNANLCC